MGLLQRDASEFLQGIIQTTSIQLESGEANKIIDSNAIDSKILARIAAKKAKNFAEADRIRKELAEFGVVLEDTPQGTTWRRA